MPGNEVGDELCQCLWGYLLFRVCPCNGRVDMRFDDEPLHIHIQCLLSDVRDEFAVAADMAWIIDDRKVGYHGLELDGQIPHRLVAESRFFVRREAAVDSAKLFNTGAVDTLQGAEP